MHPDDPCPDWDSERIVAWLKANASAEVVAGKSRFGIATDKSLGIANARLRPLSRQVKRNHERAHALWLTGIREAQLVACFTEEPSKVSAEQAWTWSKEFDSWDIVDHAADLFVEARLHDALVVPMTSDEREFVRRCGFAMIAWGALHLKKEPDAMIAGWLPLIEQHARDERNFVRKAVNWALRQIGKRSLLLHTPALSLARKLEHSDNKTERWIGRDAAKELSGEKVIARLNAKAAKNALK